MPKGETMTVVELRRTCVCGYDKVTAFSLDDPCTDSQIKQAVKKDKLRWQPHPHKLKDTITIQKNVYDNRS